MMHVLGRRGVRGRFIGLGESFRRGVIHTTHLAYACQWRLRTLTDAGEAVHSLAKVYAIAIAVALCNPTETSCLSQCLLRSLQAHILVSLCWYRQMYGEEIKHRLGRQSTRAIKIS